MPILLLPDDGEKRPFQISAGLGPMKERPLVSGNDLSFGMGLEVVRPVYNVKIVVNIPKEIEVAKYYLVTNGSEVEGPFLGNDSNVYVWEGNLDPKNSWWRELIDNRLKKRKYIDFTLRSRTDGKNWSGPVKGKAEFDYVREGEAKPYGIQLWPSGHYSREFEYRATSWEHGFKSDKSSHDTGIIREGNVKGKMAPQQNSSSTVVF